MCERTRSRHAGTIAPLTSAVWMLARCIPLRKQSCSAFSQLVVPRWYSKHLSTVTSREKERHVCSLEQRRAARVVSRVSAKGEGAAAAAGGRWPVACPVVWRLGWGSILAVKRVKVKGAELPPLVAVVLGDKLAVAPIPVLEGRDQTPLFGRMPVSATHRLYRTAFGSS